MPKPDPHLVLVRNHLDDLARLRKLLQAELPTLWQGVCVQRCCFHLFSDFLYRADVFYFKPCCDMK